MKDKRPLRVFFYCKNNNITNICKKNFSDYNQTIFIYLHIKASYMITKNILKICHTTLGVFLYIFISVTNVWSITVDIPGDNNIRTTYQDVNIPNTVDGQVRWNQDDIISLIKLINNYLRLSLGVVCLAATVYGWFLLITAQWDKNKFQKANQILLGSGIWLVICVMAYVLVRVVVNLF